CVDHDALDLEQLSDVLVAVLVAVRRHGSGSWWYVDRRWRPAQAAPEARRQTGQAQPSGTPFEPALPTELRGVKRSRHTAGVVEASDGRADEGRLHLLESTRLGVLPLRQRVSGVGYDAERDQDEAQHDEDRREGDRVALLVGRGPANPAPHRERPPPLALRPGGTPVAHEEAADQERR